MRWVNSKWFKWGIRLLGMAVIVGLMLHPELRAFAPIFDALGLDGVVILMGTQLLVAATFVYSRWLAPHVRAALARLRQSRLLAGLPQTKGMAWVTGAIIDHGGREAAYLWFIACCLIWPHLGAGQHLL